MMSIYVGQQRNNSNLIIFQNVSQPRNVNLVSERYAGFKPKGTPQNYTASRNYRIRYNNSPKIRNGYTITSELFSDDCRAKGPPQNYTALRNDHIKNNKVFFDDTFAPEIALGKKLENIVWKRPSEIVKSPKFFVNGATRFDVNQGELGDCWFLAVVANISENQKHFEFVVPPDQTFDEPNYVGIFHFRFWQFERWVDIVIDDRLPTKNGILLYGKSTDPNEFWMALLEKAYAKLRGSYAELSGGLIATAQEDLYGGPSKRYGANDPSLFDILTSSHKRSLACSIESEVKQGIRADGLISNHAYSIIEVVTVYLRDGRSVILLRIRNPWGTMEWNGAWSDGSKTWEQVLEEVKNNLLRQKEDGEFFISLQDFQKIFSFVDICHIKPDAYWMPQNQNLWHVSTFEGPCIRGVTAGGNVQNTGIMRIFISIEGNEENRKYAVQNAHVGYSSDAAIDVAQTMKLLEHCLASLLSNIGHSSFQKTIREVPVRHVNETSQLTEKFFVSESKGFPPERCTNIVALSDKNCFGKFWDLMTDIATLDIIFRKFDKDRSGKLDGFELKDLLFQCGYKVNKHLLGIVMVRYGERGSMSFENFVVCVLKLREMIGEYDARKANDNPAITFNKEEFLLTTMYK